MSLVLNILFLSVILVLIPFNISDGLSELENIALHYASRNQHTCALADSYKASELLPLVCIYAPREVKGREVVEVDIYAHLENLISNTMNVCDWAVVFIASKHEGPTLVQHSEYAAKKIGVKLVANDFVSSDAKREAFFVEVIIRQYRRVAYFQGDTIFLAPISPNNFFTAIECAFWPSSTPLLFQFTDHITMFDADGSAGADSNAGVKEGEGERIIVAEYSGPSRLDGVVIDSCFLDWLLGPLKRFSNSSSTIALLDVLPTIADTALCAMAGSFWAKTFRGVLRQPYQHRHCALLQAPVQLQSPETDTVVMMHSSYIHYALRSAYPTWTQGGHRQGKVCCEAVYADSLKGSCRPLNSQVVFLPFRRHSPKNAPRGKRTSVYALHFPQFHRDPTNDRLWGTNYTDWLALQAAPERNRLKKLILRPSEMINYDLLDPNVRRWQGNLAKNFGIDGFVYHHYWFNFPADKTRESKSLVESIYVHNNIYNLSRTELINAPLAAPLQAMLFDGEPSLPFALHWANNDWTATWQGRVNTKDGDMLLQQYYPDPSDSLIEAHYQYLRRFFHDSRYIKVKGSPLLMVYTDGGKNNKAACLRVLKRLRELAIEDGFPNLHIPRPKLNSNHPSSVRRYWTSKTKYTFDSEADRTNVNDDYDADLFYPARHDYENTALPMACMGGKRDLQKRPEYLGMVSVFDNTPRRNFDEAKIWDRSVDHPSTVLSFENDLFLALVYDRCCQNERARVRGGRFILVNAWNEWGEGMALEPSNLYGRGMLQAVASAKKRAKNFRCFDK